MTVDTIVPDRDTSRANVLFISESGAMQASAFGLATAMNVVYFQRLQAEVPHIFPEDSGVKHVSSWRPFIGSADIIIVDDPSFVSRLYKDFTLNHVVLYHVNPNSYGEAGRLMNWLNPITVDALKTAMELVDIDGEPLAAPEVAPVDPSVRWWKRLIRRSRG